MTPHDPRLCAHPKSCDLCAELRINGAARIDAVMRERAADLERREAHRRNSLPPRTTEEKAARAKARAERKRQKLARRKNRKSRPKKGTKKSRK